MNHGNRATDLWQVFTFNNHELLSKAESEQGSRPRWDHAKIHGQTMRRLPCLSQTCLQGGVLLAKNTCNYSFGQRGAGERHKMGFIFHNSIESPIDLDNGDWRLSVLHMASIPWWPMVAQSHWSMCMSFLQCWFWCSPFVATVVLRNTPLSEELVQASLPSPEAGETGQGGLSISDMTPSLTTSVFWEVLTALH